MRLFTKLWAKLRETNKQWWRPKPIRKFLLSLAGILQGQPAEAKAFARKTQPWSICDLAGRWLGNKHSDLSPVSDLLKHYPLADPNRNQRAWALSDVVLRGQSPGYRAGWNGEWIWRGKRCLCSTITYSGHTTTHHWMKAKCKSGLDGTGPLGPPLMAHQPPLWSAAAPDPAPDLLG